MPHIWKVALGFVRSAIKEAKRVKSGTSPESPSRCLCTMAISIKPKPKPSVGLLSRFIGCKSITRWFKTGSKGEPWSQLQLQGKFRKVKIRLN